MKRGLIAWAVSNPVAMNLLMVLILALGFYSQAGLPRENFPDFSIDRLVVSMTYPGASPEEVEEGICIKIEEAIESVEGIESTSSKSEEGIGSVIVKVARGSSSRQVMEDLDQAVSRVQTFPRDAEDPVVRELLLRTRVMELVLRGPLSESELKELARELRDQLLALGTISDIETIGTRPYEISIELDEAAMRSHGLSFEAVAARLRASTVSLPAGSIRTDREQYSVRVDGRRYRGDEFTDLVVLTTLAGATVRLSDIATVRDEFEEEPIIMRVGDQPAVMLALYKSPDQNAIAIADQVESFVEATRRDLPTGVALTVWSNETRYIKARLELLSRNGLMGLVLVFASLWLFLELRLAFWVAWGIPVSFAGAAFIFALTGQTLNLISAFGLIMALGIIVDDAIVVGENVYAHIRRGKSCYDAAIDGTREVMVPVVASTATTVAAFVPLFLVTGVMGKFISVLPLAMISCLIMSLIEAMLILPVHLRHGDDRRQTGGRSRRIRDRIEGGYSAIVDRVYAPILRLALTLRPLTFAVFAACLILAGGAYFGGYVRTNFFPKEDSESYIARLRLSDGTSVDETRRRLALLESCARQLDQEFSAENGGPVVDRIITVSGQWSGLPPERGPHFGEVQVELTNSELRRVDSERIISRWRALVGVVPEAVSLLFQTRDLKPGGAPLEVQLLGNELPLLRAAAEEVVTALQSYTGVFDVEHDLRPGKRELVVRSLTPLGRSVGLSLEDVSQSLRGTFRGAEVRRVQRGRDEVKVRVRAAGSDRRRVDRLEQMRIRTRDGRSFALTDVALFEVRRGLSVIARRDSSRRVLITADVDEAVARGAEVLADFAPNALQEIVTRYGLRYSLEGQAQESQDSIDSLGPGFALSLLLIYGILSVLFRSYGQPFVIMAAIPFALIGVLAGHAAFGLDLTLLSMFGAVALTGIVVNDALVLVDFINRNRARLGDLRRAVEEAGASRFRAITLTSLTTVAGLFPLVLENDRQAKFLIPMAVTISVGLAFATLINLILVPVMTMLLDDLTRLTYGSSEIEAGVPAEAPGGSGLGRDAGESPLGPRGSETGSDLPLGAGESPSPSA